MDKNERRRNAVYIISLTSASIFLLFFRLGDRLIHVCDELATAYFLADLVRTGDWISIVDFGNHTHGSIKPPLFLWAEYLSYQLFGFNELSLRLVPAFCGLVTILSVHRFVYRKTGASYTAFCCAVVLLTAQGFINHHVTRTGDYDSMLTMFTTLYVFQFYNYIHTGKLTNLLGFAFFLAMAFLTKSTAALIFLPFLFILYVSYNKISQQSLRHGFISLLLFTALVVPYYIVKEFRSNGFIEYAFKYEMIGKFVGKANGFPNKWWKSMKELFVVGRFQPWALFLPFALRFCFRKTAITKDLLIYSLLLAIGFLLVITFSSTQLSWYLAPFYPVAAIAVGLTIVNIVSSYPFLRKIFYLFFLFFAIGMVYKVFVRKTNQEVSYEMKTVLRDPDKYGVVFHQYPLSLTQQYYIDRAVFSGNSAKMGSVGSGKPGGYLFFDASASLSVLDSLPAGYTLIGQWDKNWLVRYPK